MNLMTKVGKLRMWEWVVMSAVLLGCMYLWAPQQMPVVMYKLNLITLSGVLAYWIDRSLFRDAIKMENIDYRTTQNSIGAARMVARALIFVGVVLGVSLGL